MARAAEGEVGDPLTPRMLLKVAKKTASCGTAFADQTFGMTKQTFGMIKQKEDRMIRGIIVSLALAAGLSISIHSGSAMRRLGIVHRVADHYWIGSGGFENFPAAVDKTKTPDRG